MWSRGRRQDPAAELAAARLSSAELAAARLSARIDALAGAEVAAAERASGHALDPDAAAALARDAGRSATLDNADPPNGSLD